MTALQAALYVRVSTNDQELEGQANDLRAYAAGSGFLIATEYREKETATGAGDRKEYDRLLRDARNPDRRWSIILIWSVDRFSRQARYERVVDLIHDLEARGIRFRFMRDPECDTPLEWSLTREIMLALKLLIARGEAETITARTQLAMDDLKSGRRRTRSGKPVGRPVRVTDAKAEAIERWRDSGLAWAAVAQKVGLPKGTCRWVHSERKRGRWKSRALETVSKAVGPPTAEDGPVDSI